MAETTALVRSSNKELEQVIQKEGFKKSLQIALPPHITPDRLIRIALFSVKRNEKLMECSATSIMAAVMHAAVYGLEPGIRSEAHIIPYGKEAKFQLGYQGLIRLAFNSGEIDHITPFIVYYNDECKIDYTDPKIIIKHVPWFDLGKRESGGIKYGYCRVYFLSGGCYTLPPMPLAEIHKNHRDKSSAWRAYKKGLMSSSPWADFEEEMVKKTVIIVASKNIPVSADRLRQAIAADGKSWDRIEPEIFEHPAETASSDDFLTDEQKEEVEEQAEPPKAGKEATDWQADFKAAYLASGRPSPTANPKMFKAFLEAETLTLKNYKENTITRDQYETMITKLKAEKAEKNPQAPDEIDISEAGIEDAEITIRCAYKGCKANVPAHVAELSWEKFKANYCEEHYNEKALVKH